VRTPSVNHIDTILFDHLYLDMQLQYMLVKHSRVQCLMGIMILLFQLAVDPNDGYDGFVSDMMA